MRIGTPHGRWPPRRTFLAACLLSVLTGCTFTFLMSTHAAAHDSSKVLLSANRVERLVVDMETGQLGFVATGDRRSLTPWLAARAAFPGEAARLQRLAEETGASQGARAREIVRAADAYLREHSAPLVDAAQRDLRKARSLIARGEGRRRIDAIRGQFDRFTEVQHQISSARERDAVPATRRMIAMAAGTSGSLLVVLLLVGLVTRTGIRRPPPPARAGEPEALRRAATLVARGGPLEETLRAVADEARRLLGEDHVTIGRYDPDGGMTILTRPSTRESPPTPATGSPGPSHARVPTDTRPPGDRGRGGGGCGPSYAAYRLDLRRRVGAAGRRLPRHRRRTALGGDVLPVPHPRASG